jgi:hypothetical protein
MISSERQHTGHRTRHSPEPSTPDLVCSTGPGQIRQRRCPTDTVRDRRGDVPADGRYRTVGVLPMQSMVGRSRQVTASFAGDGSASLMRSHTWFP